MNTDERQCAEGPVSQVGYLRVEYGRFEDYADWLNSTWKADYGGDQEAGLIIDYKVITAAPKSPDEPNIILMITLENMAALDHGVELEEVAKNVIGNTGLQ